MEKLDRAVSKYNEGCANLATDPVLINPQEKITQHPAVSTEQERLQSTEQKQEWLQDVREKTPTREVSTLEQERLQDVREKTPTREVSTLEQERLQDEYINALVELAGDVGHEEERSDQEGVSEEELAIFDILSEDVTLSPEEHAEVKKVAQALLATLRPTFDILDWQKKPLTRGRVSTIINDELVQLPQQEYSAELCAQKHDALFLYVQERYKNDGDVSAAG